MRYITHLRGVPTGVICAGVAVLIGMTPLGQALDDWFTDACFLVRGTRTTAANVVIIAVDEASLDQLRKPAAFLSPELARVVHYARKQEAAVVGLDVFIPEALSGLKEIEDADGIGEGRSLGEVVAEKNLVVLPCYYDSVTNGLRRPLVQWWALRALAPSRTDFGLLNLTEDQDQFVRRQALVDDLNKPDPLPFFALALYARSQEVDAFAADLGHRFVEVGGVRIPVGADGRMRVNYVGPAGSFPVISLGEVLSMSAAAYPCRS